MRESVIILQEVQRSYRTLGLPVIQHPHAHDFFPHRSWSGERAVIKRRKTAIGVHVFL